MATDSAVSCPSVSAQILAGEVLALTRIDDVRLSYPSDEPGPLLIGDYHLTPSCIRPGKHVVERDEDHVKVYIVVTDLNATLPRDQAQQCRPVTEEYSIPLEGFGAGETVNVWVNGTERTLVVSEAGEVTEPAVRVTGPAVQGPQVRVAQNRPPRPTPIPVVAGAILSTQERYGVTPDGFAQFTAPVEEVSMALSGVPDAAPTLTLVTTLPNSCQEFAKYEVIGFNPGLSVNVTNEYRPPAANGDCGGSHRSVETHIALEDFELGRKYERCLAYNVYVNGAPHLVRVEPASSSEECP